MINGVAWNYNHMLHLSVCPVRGDWSSVFNNPEIITKILSSNMCTLQMFHIEHSGTNVDFITYRGLKDYKTSIAIQLAHFRDEMILVDSRKKIVLKDFRAETRVYISASKSNTLFISDSIIFLFSNYRSHRIIWTSVSLTKYWYQLIIILYQSTTFTFLEWEKLCFKDQGISFVILSFSNIVWSFKDELYMPRRAKTGSAICTKGRAI